MVKVCMEQAEKIDTSCLMDDKEEPNVRAPPSAHKEAEQDRIDPVKS